MPPTAEFSPASQHKKTALITGASSGIGRAFALELAKQRQWNLILVARRQNLLEQLRDDIQSDWRRSNPPQNGPEGLPIITIECVDLLSQAERTALLDRLAQKETGIDLLINNAGAGRIGSFEQDDIENAYRSIELHCAAPLHICKFVLRDMLLKRSGKIINVCSQHALLPMPFAACYGASKTFLLYFTLGLAEEIRGSGVKILAVCPGAVDTPGRSSHNAPKRKSLLPLRTPEQVAKSALKALDTPASLHMDGFTNYIAFKLLRIMPILLATRIHGLVTRKTLSRFAQSQK